MQAQAIVGRAMETDGGEQWRRSADKVSTKDRIYQSTDMHLGPDCGDVILAARDSRLTGLEVAQQQHARVHPGADVFTPVFV